MGKRKTIVCLETGKQFNSVENAANAIGSAASGMAGGYHWEYADD